jgi:Glycosyltransferases involved in cell wall biogenesis
MLITAFLFFVTFAHHIEDDTFFAPDNHGRFFVVFPQEEQGGGLPNSSSLPPVLRSTANEKEKQQQHLTIHNGNYNAVSTMTTNALPQPQDDLWHVSVVILTFKKHDALAKLLSTVISQKGVNLEIIIVDNGCKPATQQVVQDAFNMTLNGTQQQEEEGTRKK